MSRRLARVPQAELVRVFDLFNRGRHAEMELAASALAQRWPGDGQAWKAWGIALLVQRKDALLPLQRALALLPVDAEVASNLGGLYAARRQFDDAVACYRRALASNPGLAGLRPALANVLTAQGLTLQAAGQPQAALPCLQQALPLHPDGAAAHTRLADLLADLGRHQDAVAHFRQALALQPGSGHVHSNLGVALLALGRPDEACAALQQAVALQPDLALAHSNLGNALLALGRVSAALLAYQQALTLAPDRAVVHSNLAHGLKTAGQPAAALRHLRQALVLTGPSPAPEALALHSACLFTRQYLAPGDADAVLDDTALHGSALHDTALDDARRFGAAAAQPAQPFDAWPNCAPLPGKCLRIGLLSPDLRAHPVGYFCESLLAALATQHAGRVELWAYASHRGGDDAVSLRLRACCQRWLAVADLDDAALAQRIHADGIDVLIDLSGHTLNNRLPVLAWRPAPVQVNWLGYCASTGLAAVDAFIGDPWITPPAAQAQFAETIVRLPETFFCFTPPALDLAPGPLPALRGAGLRFACFNHLAKVNDAVVALWSRVLHAVPGSTLALQSAPLQDPALRQQLGARFAGHGIGAERLRLQTPQPRADYLAAYQQVDIALDPFPYPGGTTSLEALWMGVPVLTLAGASALSRQGQSILQNLGMGDWVATDAQGYLDRALRHASDLPALAALRAGLRGRLLQSPLCDAPRFAAHFEAALRGLWQGGCARRGA